MRVMVLAVCVAVSAAALVAFPTAADEQPAALRSAVQREKAREATVKSLECAAAVRKLVPKGSIVMPGQGGAGPNWTGLPRQDAVLQGTLKLAMDGHKFFFDRNNSDWNPDEQEFRPYRKMGALAEGRDVSVSPDGNWATVGPGPSGDVLDLMDFLPMRFAYRLFDTVLGAARPEEVTLVGSDVRDGHPCTVIEQRSRIRSDRWWLAEDQDCCPIYWQILNPDGSLGSSASMQYGRTSAGIWRLESWDLEVIFGGSFVESDKATVTDLRLNEPVDPALFRIILPAGTYVADQLEHREYVVGEGEQPKEPAADKAMDEFVGKVRNETARPKRATPPPARSPGPVRPPVQAVSAPPRGLPSWLFCAGGALVVLVVVAILVSRRRAPG
jgi:hypothetical protein